MTHRPQESSFTSGMSENTNDDFNSGPIGLLLFIFIRSAPKVVPASGVWGKPAPSTHHCVSLQHTYSSWLLVTCPSCCTVSHRRYCTDTTNIQKRLIFWNIWPWPFPMLKPLSKLVYLYNLALKGWSSRQSVSDGGVCPGLARGPAQHSWRGLSLGGWQEWGWPGTEVSHKWPTQAWLPESQRSAWSCRVSVLHCNTVRPFIMSITYSSVCFFLQL